MLSVLFFVLTFCTTITLAIRQSAVYLFVLYQAYYFFNPNTKWWGSYIPDISYSFYIVLTLLVITIINWTKLSENKLVAIPQFMFMYFTAFLYFVASFYAILPDVHAIAFDAILTVTVLVTIIYKLVRTEEHLDIILIGYVTFAGYMGYYVSQFGRTTNGRFEGAGMVDSPDANGLGAALAPAVIICLYYLWCKPKWWAKLFFGIIGIYLANSLVQIGSRGAFLGVLFGLTVFIWILYFSKLQRKNQKSGVVALVFIGLIGLSVVADSAFWERMGTIKTQDVESAAEQESGSTRVYFWLAAIEMAKDHPFGAGASGFIYYSPIYISDAVQDTGGSRNRAVHSTWFEVLSEIGYLGFISFVGMILYSFVTIFRTMKKLKEEKQIEQYFKVLAIGCALSCFVISMTFLNRFRAEILYWCILYTAIAYNIFVLKSDLAIRGEPPATR
jgi:hypothetical protein